MEQANVRANLRSSRSPGGPRGLGLALALWSGAALAAPPAMDWTVTFTRTLNGADQYIGGFTDTITGITAVMYQENGVEYRVRRYNGSGALLGDTVLADTDISFDAFTVDGSGNYVTAGTINSLTGSSDLGAAVFTPAGALVWQTPYDSGYNETASGVAVDAAGNVFVAGTIQSGAGGTPDAELVSFDATGVFRWASVVDNGGNDSGVAVAADPAGNSYLTGQTIDTSSADVAYVRACDPTGAIVFTQTYAGTAWGTIGQESGRAVAWNPSTNLLYLGADAYLGMDVFAIDPATGDVVTAGTTPLTFASYQLVGGIAADSAGGVIVTGVTGTLSNFDLLVQAFDPTLAPLWTKTYDEGTGDAFSNFGAPDHFAATGVAVGVSGSVFVTGALTQPTCFNQGDLFTRVYSAAGATVWTRVYDGPSYDDVAGVDADAAGDAYLGGTASSEPALLKFAGATGALTWTRFPTTPGACAFGAGGLARSGGAEYLSYAAQTPSTGAIAAYVNSYDAAGVSGTAYTFSLIPEAFDGPVATDAAGDVLMAGAFISSTTSQDDLYVVKWNPLGTIAWTVTLNAAQGDNPAGIAVDGGGNTYVLETTPGTGAAGDAHLLIKLDPSGGVLWTSTFSANPLLAEQSASLSFNAGMLVVGGTERDPATGAVTGQVWRLDTSGNVMWMNVPPGSPDAVVNGVRADPFGRIFTAGATGDPALPAWDQQATSLDATGASRWNVTYDSGRPLDFGRKAAYHSPDEIFVAGIGTGVDRLTKYTEPPLAALAAWLSIVPNATAPGQWVQVVLTVTNGGNAPVTGLMPSVELNAGFGLVSQIGGPAPVPPGPVTLASGAVTSFTWTFSAQGAGLVGFTATGAGTDTGSGNPILASSSATLLIGARAALAGTVRLVPPSTSLYVGQMFSIELTVTNTGGIPALNVRPLLVPLQGSGTMLLFSGPVPPGPLSLGAGSATTFVWSFTVTGSGPLSATVYALGWDGLSSTLLAGARVSVTYYHAGQIATTLATYPALAVTQGLPLTVYVTVFNTGEVPVTGVTPVLAPDSGGALVSPNTGPVPPGPVTIAGGGSQRFTWTYNTVGAGDVEFSETTTATDTGLGTALTSTMTGLEAINAPSMLLPAWKLSATTVEQGALFVERLTVSNTGGTAAWYVTPSASPVVASPWRALQTAGPVPPSQAILAPGATATFTYTFRATATGYIDLSATVGGQDAATLAVLSPVGAFSSTVLVLADAILATAASVSPATLRAGAPFTFALTVTNTGAADAVAAIPALTLGAPGLARVDTGPVPAAGGTIAAGASVTYTWALTSLDVGTLVLTGAISATDAGTATARKVSGSAQATAVLTPHPDGEIAVYPNPAGTGTLHVYLHLDAPATGVTLDVYDASMRRVYTGTWGAVSVLDGTLDIAGIDAWAPGIYLVRAVATLADGSTRKYPVVKLKVRR